MSTTDRPFKNDTDDQLARFGKGVLAATWLELQWNRGKQPNRLELGALDRQARSKNPTTEVKS